jgi:aminotransferase in exopolysaccharide biosynthesis
MSELNGAITAYIKSLFPNRHPVPLHAPVFPGNEERYLVDCLKSTYVSYVGSYVSRFEEEMTNYTGAAYAIATVNGTVALHLALSLAGVKPGDEVLVPALTFVATANAVSHCGASPVFLDCERSTLGMDPDKLGDFLMKESEIRDDGFCYNRGNGKRISACVPVHVFGHPARIDRLKELCDGCRIAVIEDAAEAIGSRYKGRHVGTLGLMGTLSFNGNKTITTGGGGMIITNDEGVATKAGHLSTTAKKPHRWEYVHDYVGYNYRMPNVNAALGCAQMEALPGFITAKRELAGLYRGFFEDTPIDLFVETADCRSNYWLNAITLRDREERDSFLEYTNSRGVVTRPVWKLISSLDMYRDCQRSDLENSLWLEDRVVNIPSGVRA